MERLNLADQTLAAWWLVCFCHVWSFPPLQLNAGCSWLRLRVHSFPCPMRTRMDTGWPDVRCIHLNPSFGIDCIHPCLFAHWPGFEWDLGFLASSRRSDTAGANIAVCYTMQLPLFCLGHRSDRVGAKHCQMPVILINTLQTAIGSSTWHQLHCMYVLAMWRRHNNLAQKARMFRVSAHMVHIEEWWYQT